MAPWATAVRMASTPALWNARSCSVSSRMCASIHCCMVTLRPDCCRCQYSTVRCGIMTRRLTAQDWIDFGLAALARNGADALKADVLARKLKVSRGSFYWHFADLEAFHARVIEQWKKVATEAIITDIERYRPHDERLDVLLRHAFG